MEALCVQYERVADMRVEYFGDDDELTRPGLHAVKRPALKARRRIGRAHVSTPVTNAHLVCRLLLGQKRPSEYLQTQTHFVQTVKRIRRGHILRTGREYKH